MEKKNYEFIMKVRDYECDAQGIVNNANYLHYLENTRHEFTGSLGICFTDLHGQGIDTVVAHIDIHYKSSLRGSDLFASRLRVKREGIKLVFLQEIYKLPEERLCCHAQVEVVIIQDGKLTRGNYFDEALKPYL